MISEGLLKIGAQIVLSKVADNVLSEVTNGSNTQSSNLNLLSSNDSGDLATSIFSSLLSETLDSATSDSFSNSSDLISNVLMSSIENSDLTNIDASSIQFANPLLDGLLGGMSDFAMTPFEVVLNGLQNMENAVFNLFGFGANSNSKES